ncbi:GNAT family N-acetyltransferase [Winogradskyella ursingii]|uniref:GNAT family N-acetyltransferase n=1 Tax=Winogradskyella ursingii TaxID=2686079 RepID=UPI0015CBCF4A|nr:GNAT family N-acetyltransferase [Winogradskyella ursingii]
MIGNIPFLSATFKSIWLKHFNRHGKSVQNFKCLSGLDFIDHPKFPALFNVGSTHTKGINYTLNAENQKDISNNTLLIFDVPTYFNIQTSDNQGELKCYKSKQYPGFLIETSKFESLNDYMLSHFSKNSRNKNNKYKRRLESSFDISYKMFLGQISEAEFESVFKAFKTLLEKRFEDKKITNNNLENQEWEFYKEVAYPMILEKKASLFVIYDGSTIIGVTLCYLSEEILFDAITVFDIDYFKFHLGSVTIMKLIEWCIENKIKILDFSKGYFDYKTRWCTQQYDFEYHIYYNTKSLKSKITAAAIKRFYDAKQTLREKNINEKLHKLTYRLNNKPNTIMSKVSYNFEEINNSIVEDKKTIIDFENAEDKSYKLLIFEFLYLYEEQYGAIKLFQFDTDNHKFLIEGEKKSIIATIETN